MVWSLIYLLTKKKINKRIFNSRFWFIKHSNTTFFCKWNTCHWGAGPLHNWRLLLVHRAVCHERSISRKWSKPVIQHNKASELLVISCKALKRFGLSISHGWVYSQLLATEQQQIFITCVWAVAGNLFGAIWAAVCVRIRFCLTGMSLNVIECNVL